LAQVDEIKALYPRVNFETHVFLTQGDKDKITSISEVDGSDFFTKEIDDALLRGEIDLAVHSSKDLPDILSEGLAVLLETESICPYDALVSKDKRKFAQLPSGLRIGTSSLRRKSTVRLLRPDLRVIDIRGNIGERLALIGSRKIDALIVAFAALIRLGRKELISEVFPLEVFKTHPKQGSLSLMVRHDRWQEVKSILSGQGQATGN